MAKIAGMAPSSLRTWSMTFTYGMLAALALYAMRIMPQAEFGIDKYMETVTKAGVFPNGVPLRQKYTGIAAVDFGLSFLVAAFIDGTSGWDSAFQLQQIYFLFSFFAVISIWEVEACRTRSGLAMGSLLFLWTIAYQTVGGAVIIPLYYLAYTWITSKKGYYELPRKVPIPVAKALLPALLIGYLIPTIVLFWPFKDIRTVQAVTALWQPAPLFPIILLAVLPRFMSDQASPRSSVPADVKYLKRLYTTAGVLTALVHVVEVYAFLMSKNPQISLSRAFILDFQMASTSPARALLYIFQVDFWVIFAASLIWCGQAVWDLRQMGATSLGLVEAAALITLGSVIFGPGAAMCAVWYWREDKMLSLSQEVSKKR